MRKVGTRRHQAVGPSPSDAGLSAAAVHLRTAAVLAAVNTTGIARGVYRFRTHEEANRHADEALSRAIAENVRARRMR